MSSPYSSSAIGSRKVQWLDVSDSVLNVEALLLALNHGDSERDDPDGLLEIRTGSCFSGFERGEQVQSLAERSHRLRFFAVEAFAEAPIVRWCKKWRDAAERVGNLMSEDAKQNDSSCRTSQGVPEKSVASPRGHEPIANDSGRDVSAGLPLRQLQTQEKIRQIFAATFPIRSVSQPDVTLPSKIRETSVMRPLLGPSLRSISHHERRSLEDPNRFSTLGVGSVGKGCSGKSSLTRSTTSPSYFFAYSPPMTASSMSASIAKILRCATTRKSSSPHKGLLTEDCMDNANQSRQKVELAERSVPKPMGQKTFIHQLWTAISPKYNLYWPTLINERREVPYLGLGSRYNHVFVLCDEEKCRASAWNVYAGSDEALLEMLHQERHCATCAVCNNAIVGARWKCRVCPDFDVCGECYMDGEWKAVDVVHEDHQFIRCVLPHLYCSQRHLVNPRWVSFCASERCAQCNGQLQSTTFDGGQSVRFQCEEPTCGFALCGDCYWEGRRALWQIEEGGSCPIAEEAQSWATPGCDQSTTWNSTFNELPVGQSSKGSKSPPAAAVVTDPPSSIYISTRLAAESSIGEEACVQAASSSTICVEACVEGASFPKQQRGRLERRPAKAPAPAAPTALAYKPAPAVVAPPIEIPARRSLLDSELPLLTTSNDTQRYYRSASLADDGDQDVETFQPKDAPSFQTVFDSKSPPLSTPLRCHMLFSSLLCVERPVIVRVSCAVSARRLASTKSASESEVNAWKLVFETSHPGIVKYVLADGLIGAWNLGQEHAESMVRPSDELLWLSVGGMREQLKGRDVASTLRVLCERLCASSEGHEELDAPGCQIELLFRALRALPPLRIEQEHEFMRLSGCEVVTGAATANALRALIAASDCRALHLSLHCSISQDHLLFLEDSNGKAHIVRASEIQKILTQGQQQQSIKLVFLSACHSMALGAHFVDAGVCHVICVRNEDEVRDESCLLFARDFWSALRSGRSVSEAFECGKAILACSDDPTLRVNAPSFVLLPEGGDHSERFAPKGGASIAPPPHASPGGSWGALSSRVEDFVGREVDMYRLLQQVSSRRFVEVRGVGGVGKSVFVAEVGRFLSLRGASIEEVRFMGQCVNIDLRREFLVGLKGLRQRLGVSCRRRVLLILDNVDSSVWAAVQEVLGFGGVHVLHIIDATVASAAAESDAGAGGGFAPNEAGRSAIACGLKPVVFYLAPLEPLSQVRLFLRRVSRPLRCCELQGDLAHSGDGTILQPPRAPAEFLRIADTPLFHMFGGIPKRIVEVAMLLSSSPSPSVPAFSLMKVSSGDASGGPCLSTQPSSPEHTLPSTQGGWRKVRLLRPDGKSKDEWLLDSLTVSQLIHDHCPQALRGKAEAFVAGCRAPANAKVADFSDNVDLQVLIVEFRPREEDW